MVNSGDIRSLSYIEQLINQMRMEQELGDDDEDIDDVSWCTLCFSTLVCASQIVCAYENFMIFFNISSWKDQYLLEYLEKELLRI